MSRYLPEPHRGLLPAPASGKLARTLKQMDAQAVALERADELRIGRSVQATRKGMAGLACIAVEEAAWIRALPHAEARFRTAAEAGSATVLGHIFEAGV
jgi:hypothetical protein